MQSSFEDRLNRIEANAADAPAAPPTQEFVGRLFPREHLPLQPSDPAESAASFSTKYRRQIIRNLATGFVWMAMTCFMATQRGTIIAWIEASPMFSPDYATYMTLYYMALVASFGGFAFLCHSATDRYGIFFEGVKEKAPISLIIGGALGAVVGFGPAVLFGHVLEFHEFMNVAKITGE